MTTLLRDQSDDTGPVPTARARRRVPWGDLVAVALVAGLVTAACLVGWALLRRGVPIHVDFPPLLAQWLPHVGPGTVPAVLVALLVVLWGPTVARRFAWGPLLVIAYVASLAWTIALATIDGWTRGVAERLATDTEYLRIIPIRGTVRDFLGNFARRIPSFQPDSWPTHVSGHPPLAPLFYDALYIWGYPGGAWAGAITAAIGASAVVAVAVTVAVLAGWETARRYLPFGVLFPGAVWVGVSADGMFAAVFAWGVALFAIGCGLRPRLREGVTAGGLARGLAGLVFALLGGAVLGLSLFLSYGLVLGGLIPVAVAVVTRRVVPLLLAGVGVAGIAAEFASHGFWWWDGYEQVQVRYYQPGEFGLLRPFDYWWWANLAALALVVGPAVVAGLRRWGWYGWRGRSSRSGRIVPLAVTLLVGAAVVAVLVADLSGLSKAETERIWLPFAVWMMLSAALLPRGSVRWWLLAQAALALVVNHLLLTVW